MAGPQNAEQGTLDQRHKVVKSIVELEKHVCTFNKLEPRLPATEAKSFDGKLGEL